MSYDKTPFDKKNQTKKPFTKKFDDKKFGDKKASSLDMHGSTPKKPEVKFDRIAKVMARAGLCSRRDAERWIADSRVSVNGRLLTSPAVKVSEKDIVKVDGKKIKAPEATRLWKYYKPAGLVTSHGDPEGRPTVFSRLRQEGLPRVVSVGRLDINTEGLILITNNGSLARHLEMPSTGWQRKYRARAYGKVTQMQLDTLKAGITVNGVQYGSILATLERQTGDNCWISLTLREGKNREIKEVLGSFDLQVNRLIRISFGPFKLDNMERGTVAPIPTQMLKDQLGTVYDEIDEGYDAELRPQDQVGYYVNSRDKDDRKTSENNRSGYKRRDDHGGRSFSNDRDDRRGNRDDRDKDEKRPGRNNERPSFNRNRDDKKGRDDKRSFGDKKRSFSDNKGKPGTGQRERPRGGRDRDGNPRSSERREGARTFDRGAGSKGGRSDSAPRRGNRDR